MGSRNASLVSELIINELVEILRSRNKINHVAVMSWFERCHRRMKIDSKSVEIQ